MLATRHFLKGTLHSGPLAPLPPPHHQNAGEAGLEADQVAKINSEAQLLAELHALGGAM